jgi:hypothetical protein
MTSTTTSVVSLRRNRKTAMAKIRATPNKLHKIDGFLNKLLAIKQQETSNYILQDEDDWDANKRINVKLQGI